MTNIFFIHIEKSKEIAAYGDAQGVIAPGGGLFRNVRTKEEFIEIMQVFYNAEERQLLEAGLNQSSVAIILQRMKEYERSVIINLELGISVLTGKYIKAIDALQTFVQRISRTARKQSVQMGNYVKLPSEKPLHDQEIKLSA
jgi:hypothetical protein